MIAPYFTPALRNGKHLKVYPAPSKQEQQLRATELTVELLIARVGMSDYWAEGFREAGKLLAAVLFPTAEFAFAIGHLQNAVGYCQQKEFGAAAFELRALRGQLQRL